MGNIKKSTDKDLISQMALGNEMAFTVLFNKYYNYAFNVALLYCDILDAEEVISDVFAKIWDRRSELINVANFKSYLFTSLKNQCFNYLRKKRIRTVAMEDLFNSTVLKESDPLFQTEANELDAAVAGVISQLPPKCNDAYTLVYEKGYKYKEAAIKLGISENTLEAHLKKATKRIMNVIKSYGLHCFLFLLGL